MTRRRARRARCPIIRSSIQPPGMLSFRPSPCKPLPAARYTVSKPRPHAAAVGVMKRMMQRPAGRVATFSHISGEKRLRAPRADMPQTRTRRARGHGTGMATRILTLDESLGVGLESCCVGDRCGRTTRPVRWIAEIGLSPRVAPSGVPRQQTPQRRSSLNRQRCGRLNHWNDQRLLNPALSTAAIASKRLGTLPDACV